ncbi:hypothetical protein A0J52_06240 [Clostridium sporogenes]|nr:hypothetical protein IYC_18515 [Clostridium sporogenes PA 3679]KYN78880.1 hypothetical protein A0J52_06240 [Clostridium sporogenes]
MEGIIDIASILPNRVEDPLISNKYSGNTKRRIALPISEIICPITIKEKSLLNSFIFSFIIFILPLFC